MRIVMRPLNENYKTISVRATQMESFAMCPYMSKFQPPKLDNEESLLFGTLVDAMLWSFVMWSEKWYVLSDLIAKQHTEIAQYAIFYQNIPAYVEYLKDKSVICTHLKMTYEIEMWDYLIILSWEMDVLFMNDAGKYVMADWKTSKSERDQETMNTKIQKYLYPFLLSQYVWRENIEWFDYLVFTKHALPKPKKDGSKSTREWPRFWLWSHKPEQKYIEDYMYNLFDYYCRSVDENLFIPKQDNWCFYCKLKKLWQCPVYKTSTDVPVADNTPVDLDTLF